MDKTTRCTDCAAEFTDEEIQGATRCPACGTTGLPSSIDQDTTIQINWHELRILTIWASNWASAKCDEGAQRTLNSIIKRLEAQRKNDWPALTILGEIKELPAQLAKHGIEIGNVQLYDAAGKRVHPPLPRVVLDDDEADLAPAVIEPAGEHTDPS